MLKQRNYQELRRDFTSPPAKYRPVSFIRVDGDFSDEEKMNTILNTVKRAGYGGISPIPVADLRRAREATTPLPGSDAYFDAYEKLLERAKKMDLQVVYYDDVDFPSGSYMGKVLEKYPELKAQMLVMREYECMEGEITRRTLDTDGVTLSVVAYELDTGEIIDVREDVTGDTLVWDTPDGNWNILQFVCRDVPDTRFVNLLDYKACSRFVECSYKAFTDRFQQYLGDVVRMTYYDDIQYLAPNRRMWSADFNEVFQREFGFDPAPYYPALFYDIGPKTDYYTALFMKCRAKMLADGFFRAVADFTQKFGLLCTGHVSESKTAAVSNLFGDAMLIHSHAGAPGLDMIHAYMYGFNGLKLASSAAYNYDKELVTCELFKTYQKLDTSILYRETMNVFARGVNFVMPNVMQWSGDESYNHDVSVRSPEYRDILPQWTDFAARCQAMLQGGSHVCEIAMLYPIDSLHSKVWLYDQHETTFQFAPVLSFADYINNINSVMNYCGRDLTVLHPDVFSERGRAENGILYLDNDVTPERYRILIMPAMTIVSIRVLRLIRDFYTSGGKILATAVLPFHTLEGTPEAEAEAAEIIESIFGVKENAVNYVSDYEMRSGENGGMAVFLRTSMTDLDGTLYVEANRINETLWRFDTPVDIAFEHLPRIARSGILSLNLPAFRNSGAAMDGIKSGGVFNYIHKRHDGCDVYYVSNTTVKDYAGRIVICGTHEVEEWNPHTGKIRHTQPRYGFVNDIGYTSIDESIPSNTSVFLVCTPTQKTPEQTEANSFSDFGSLRKYYEELDGKKTVKSKQRLFNW